ncbi:MAG: hypothetical protein KatS3mg032_2345 [Cyclobacteriaceae bacterium]|nr:MAG: hypothetical protein KatS3mg032_2345 [Cyclobacteriaceae bacterium]
MNWIARLTGTRKRPKARCPITGETIEPEFGYLLTTAQIIASEKFWDMVMTEPETLSYTMAHFSNDTNGTHMRSLIFEKYSQRPGPWMISDTCIGMFEVNRHTARNLARLWWQAGGSFTPDHCGPATETVAPDELSRWKSYAILEAGRERLNKIKLREAAIRAAQ